MADHQAEAAVATPVVVVGARVFCEEITDVARAAGVEVAGWIEAFDRHLVSPDAERPIVWLDDQADLAPELPVVVVVVKPEVRRACFEQLLGAGRRLARSIVHPAAILGGATLVEDGCVLFPGVMIGTRSRVGAGTIVNRGASIGHHTKIGRHCFIGPGAVIAGQVTVGERATIGIGAAVRDEKTIGADACLGAGAVAVGDIPAGVTAVGVPARPIKKTAE